MLGLVKWKECRVCEEMPIQPEDDLKDRRMQCGCQARPWRIAKAAAAARFSLVVLLKMWVR